MDRIKYKLVEPKNSLMSETHRYKTDIGVISMVEPCWYTDNEYEIYCLEGDLFDDIERYSDMSEVEERLIELLCVK